MKSFQISAFALLMFFSGASQAKTCVPKVQNSIFSKFEIEVSPSQNNITLSKMTLGPKANEMKDPKSVWPTTIFGTSFAPGKYGRFQDYYEKSYLRIQVYIGQGSSGLVATEIHFASNDGVYLYETYLCQ